MRKICAQYVFCFMNISILSVIFDEWHLLTIWFCILVRLGKQRLREAKIQAVDFLILLLAGICLGTLAKVSDESFGAQGYLYTVIAVCKLKLWDSRYMFTCLILLQHVQLVKGHLTLKFKTGKLLFPKLWEGNVKEELYKFYNGASNFEFCLRNLQNTDHDFS